MALPKPHAAVPVRVTGEGTWVQGERTPSEPTPMPALTFHGSLFLPSPTEESTGRGSRQVKRPTFVFDGFDDAGNLLDLSRKDQLDITAEELTGPDPVRWQLEGDPQPAGRPGRTPRAWLATLRRIVEDRQ